MHFAAFCVTIFRKEGLKEGLIVFDRKYRRKELNKDSFAQNK